MMRCKYFVAGALAWLCLAGCGEDETVTKQTQAQKSSPPGGGSVTAADLDLRPEYPPTSGCVQATVKGHIQEQTIAWQVNGQPVDGQNGLTLCREFFRRGDEVSVEVSRGTQVMKRSLKIANAPPQVTEVELTVDPRRVNARAVTADADGDSVDLRYQWVINGEVNDFQTNEFIARSDFEPTDKLQVRITPNDGEVDGVMYTSRTFTLPNLPPQIVSVPPAIDGFEYAYQVRVRDADNDRLTFSLENPPSGMTIGKRDGKVIWPLTGVQPGQYDIKIVVRDPDGGADRQEFVLVFDKLVER